MKGDPWGRENKSKKTVDKEALKRAKNRKGKRGGAKKEKVRIQ